MFVCLNGHFQTYGVRIQTSNVASVHRHWHGDGHHKVVVNLISRMTTFLTRFFCSHAATYLELCFMYVALACLVCVST